jgi:biotin transport system substrate-specific component
MNYKSGNQKMALISLMSAITCIISPFSIMFPFSPVPFSFGTLAIYFGAIVLGCKSGLWSVSIYLLLGAVGIPVFSGFTGGIGRLLGPTGGYLIGYLFLAAICGFCADRCRGRKTILALGIVLGTVACYICGTCFYALQTRTSFVQALSIAVLPFLPGDLLKATVALFAGIEIRKRLTSV